MQVQRIQNNNYKPNFKAQLSENAIGMMYKGMRAEGLSVGEFVAEKLSSIHSWGQEDSIIDFCTKGLNKDCFVLNNSRLGVKNERLSAPSSNAFKAFITYITEKSITNAETGIKNKHVGLD